jgi:hypothetical protein
MAAEVGLSKGCVIYRPHTAGKKTIRQLADIYQLPEIRIWKICTAIRKQDEPLQGVKPFAR